MGGKKGNLCLISQSAVTPNLHNASTLFRNQIGLNVVLVCSCIECVRSAAQPETLISTYIRKCLSKENIVVINPTVAIIPYLCH